MNLNEERAKLLEEIEKNKSLPIQRTENEVQTDDDEHEKLLEVNKSLKSTIETIENKIRDVITVRSDLFRDIDEGTIERLDHLISSIQNQGTQINDLKTEYDQTKENYQHKLVELQK